MFHATQKRVVSAYSLIFSLFIFSSSRATETRSAILSCDRSFFSPQLYNNTELSDRVISTPPLLNSIRHDTRLFLEAFRHRDRFSPLFESRVTPDRCAIRASVCSRMRERTRRLPPLFSDEENTDLGTSLDRYPVWRIRFFIRIDMFAGVGSQSVVCFKIRFYPLGDIIVLCEYYRKTNKL